MSARFLPAADRAPTPWRNGGGVTREIAADQPSDQFRWRMSVAEIAADGPFSLYPRHRRILTLLQGAGMRLRVDEVTYQLETAYEPFPFPGGAQTGCELLDGPVTVFNVMIANNAQAPLVEIVRPLKPVALGHYEPTAVVCLQGEMTISGMSTHTLGTLDAVILSGEPEAMLSGAGPVVAVKVRLT